MRLFWQIFRFLLPLALLWSGAYGTSYAEKVKLAIVIDDVGYQQTEQAIYQLPKEVAVAIIPVAPYATYRAKLALAQKRDVIIHLPMQQQNLDAPLESGAIKVGMNEGQIAQIIAFARSAVPNAIGVSNHLGDMATAHWATMQNLMSVLSAQQLAFLDNIATPHSIAYQLASDMGLPVLKRTAFLTEGSDESQLQTQFEQILADNRQPFMVLVGFPEPAALNFLSRQLANLPEQVELISISQLWQSGAGLLSKETERAMQFQAAPTSQSPFFSVPLLRGIPKE